MKRHIVSRTERAILSGLKRWNKGIPEEVLAAEARQLLRARILRDNDRGMTQLEISGRLNYSVSQVERLIKVARVEREDGEPSPLLTWKAREGVMEPAPAPEAAIVERTLPKVAMFRAANGTLLHVPLSHTVILADEPAPEPEDALDDDRPDDCVGDPLNDISQVRSDLQRRHHGAVGPTKDRIGRMLLLACDLERGYVEMLGHA